jgi:hypothetical protein
VCFDQGFTDGKTEAEAAEFRSAALLESVEYFWQ